MTMIHTFLKTIFFIDQALGENFIKIRYDISHYNILTFRIILC